MRLHNIPTVQKRHLAVLLHPHLIPGMRRNHGECSDVQAELARFCEFAQAGSEGEEGFAFYGGGEIGEGFADVVDTGVLENRLGIWENDLWEGEYLLVCGRHSGRI